MEIKILIVVLLIIKSGSGRIILSEPTALASISPSNNSKMVAKEEFIRWKSNFEKEKQLAFQET